MNSPDLTDFTSLNQALELASPASDGTSGLTARVSPDFSNGPQGYPPEKGFPFGGLMAALAVKSMQQTLDIHVPLHSLNVQFMAPARYGQDLQFKAQALRRGRSVTYATAQAAQGDRLILNTTATFGAHTREPEPHSDLHRVPPALDIMLPGPGLYGPMAPHFTRYVDYRFESGPHILGGNIGKAPTERLWMRTKDGAPLDILRLCFLLDALYPPAMTLTQTYLKMTSVDLRYDFMRELTPDLAPDGWLFFEYRVLEHDFGWSIDDAKVWAADGRPVALARQRRKVL